MSKYDYDYEADTLDPTLPDMPVPFPTPHYGDMAPIQLRPGQRPKCPRDHVRTCRSENGRCVCSCCGEESCPLKGYPACQHVCARRCTICGYPLSTCVQTFPDAWVEGSYPTEQK